MAKKTSINTSLCRKHKKELTKTEQEILHLISNEFLTPKQIAIRRQTSDRAVYHHIENLKKKGYISKNFTLLHKNDTTSEVSEVNNQIRLHGLQVRFQILFKDQRYKKLLTKANLIDIDGNTIKLYRDSIIIYLNKSFFSKDIEKCTEESISYINKIAKVIENDINIIITKPRKQNIKVLMAHYSEINNEFANDLNVKAERINVYTREDNKLWFTIDNSFNLDEAECLHGESNYNDMEKVKDHFNYIRDGRNPTLKEIYENQRFIMISIKELAEHNTQTAVGLKGITEFLNSQLPKEETKEKEEYITPSYIN